MARSLTCRIVKLYLADGAYYRMASSGELANPDQRVADDARAFTASALSFFLMAFNSSLTIVTFSGVLVLISPLLSAVVVLYAAMGSYMTLLLGRPLVKLNYDQLDKEAGFRAALIHVRENAELILLARREDVQSARLLRRLDRVITNFRAITTVNRNVGFFTTGYNWADPDHPGLDHRPGLHCRQSRIRRDHAIGHGLLDGCGRVFLVCHPVSVAFGVYRRCCSA